MVDSGGAECGVGLKEVEAAIATIPFVATEYFFPDIYVDVHPLLPRAN
jgi:hypothetical protein